MSHKYHTTPLAMFFHITLAFFCLPKAKNSCIPENTLLVKNTNKGIKMDHKCHTTPLARFFHIALTINRGPKGFPQCWGFFTPLLGLLTSKHLYCSLKQLVKNTNCGEKLIGLRTYGTRNLSISAFYQWVVPDGTYTTSLFVPGCRNMLLDIQSCFTFLPLQVLGSSKHFQIQIEQKARSVIQTMAKKSLELK